MPKINMQQFMCKHCGELRDGHSHTQYGDGSVDPTKNYGGECPLGCGPVKDLPTHLWNVSSDEDAAKHIAEHKVIWEPIRAKQAAEAAAAQTPVNLNDRQSLVNHLLTAHERHHLFSPNMLSSEPSAYTRFAAEQAVAYGTKVSPDAPGDYVLSLSNLQKIHDEIHAGRPEIEHITMGNEHFHAPAKPWQGQKEVFG